MNEEIKKQVELDQLNYLVKLQKQELDRLKAENKSLRTALVNIASGHECTTCSCRCHGVAGEALERFKK